MSRTLLTVAIASALAAPLAAQNAPPPADAAVPITYVGANARIGAGIDDDGNVLGEVLGVLGATDHSAWLVQGWLAHGGAGGLKLGRHFALGEAATASTVAKVFAAVDQNADDHRKATLGVGFEREAWFLDAYLSAGLTDEREVDRRVASTDRLLQGVDGGRPFRQLETTTVTTVGYEKAYDHGIGTRIGRWFESPLLRVRGGLDYERGDHDADQLTFSAGLEKFLRNSGHSFALELEHASRDGDFVQDEDDTRAWLTWRYEPGRSFRAVQPYRDVQVERSVEVEQPAEPVVVHNQVRISEEAFFGLDSAALTKAAREELRVLVDAIRADSRASRVAVVGHTCDLGSEAYNQRLSERRAAAVREFFAGHGIDVAELEVSGRGEREPRAPNDGEANRRRNRRVEVSFLSVEARTEAAPPQRRTETRLEWVREPVAAPPAWVERALRNPAAHKRTVDVYRYETASTAVTLGPREFINRPPVAVADAVTTPRDTAIDVAVLANDSDPDGDALTVVAVGTPANGTVVRSGNVLRYTPNAGYTGTDAFSYTISDGRGGSASAQVTVAISAPPPPANRPPVAQDDYIETVANHYALIPVLDNDSDPDGDTLTIIDVQLPANGQVRVNFGRTILYVPNTYWWGTEVFTYTVSDGRGGTATATVRVRVFDD